MEDDDRTLLDRIQDLGATLIILGLPALIIAVIVWLLGWY